MADTGTVMLLLFLLLQVADFGTTMVGLKLGAQEASPLARSAMYLGCSPMAGVMLTKVAALVIAGICIWMRRRRVIEWVNYGYTGLVLWNIGIIARLAGVA